MSDIRKGLLIERLLDENNFVTISNGFEKILIIKEMLTTIIFTPAENKCLLKLWKDGEYKTINLKEFKII